MQLRSQEAKNSFDPFFFWLVILLGIAGTLNALLIAHQIPVDYYDAHNFLLQARRLTDSHYQFVGFDFTRPRALVMVLTFFDLVIYLFTHRHSTFTENHFLMVALSWGSALVWYFVLKRFWNKRVALFTLLLLFSTQLFHHYSFSILSDIFSGTLWALMGYAYLKVYEKKNHTRWDLMGLALLGALTALTKNHHLILFPFLVFLDIALKSFQWDRSEIKWLFFTFILSIDILTRIFGYSGEGIPEHLRHLILQTRHQVTEPVPWSLYWIGFWDMYGPLLIFLGLSFPLFRLFQMKRLISFKELNTNTFLRIRTSFVLVNTFYLVLNLFITHREMRYLLPFLPVFFASLLSPTLNFLFDKKLGWKILTASLFFMALLHPLRRSWEDIKVYWEDPIYSKKYLKFEELWSYLEHCPQIVACGFPLRPATPFEFKNDPYYRQYDYHPQYRYFLGRDPMMSFCAPPPNPQPNTCYVIGNPRLHPQLQINKLFTVLSVGADNSLTFRYFFDKDKGALNP